MSAPAYCSDLFASSPSIDCVVSREQDFFRLQIIASRDSRVSPFPCRLEQPNRVKDPPQFVNGYRSSLIAHLRSAGTYCLTLRGVSPSRAAIQSLPLFSRVIDCASS